MWEMGLSGERVCLAMSSVLESELKKMLKNQSSIISFEPKKES